MEQSKQYKVTLSKSLEKASFYTMVVKADEYDDSDRYITFDYVEGSPTITEEEMISQYPLINGDVISDHKYTMPISISLNGAFSLNGKYTETFTNDELLGDRLGNIIDYIEEIKSKGRIVDFMFVLDGVERYKILKNLTIKSFQWHPTINSFKFSITFQQVYFADISDFELLEDTSDENLPTLSYFKNSTFIGEVIDSEYLNEKVIKMLCDERLVNASFVDVLGVMGQYVLVAVGVAAAVAAAIVVYTTFHAVSAGIIAVTSGVATSVFAGVGASIVATLPFSAVIAIGAGLIAGITFGIIKFIRMAKRANWIKEFKGYASEKENQQEIQRFNRFLNATIDSVNKIQDQVQFYSFSANDVKQEYTLNVGNNYYIFDMEKSSTSGLWSLTILDLNNNIIGNNQAQFHNIKGLGNLLDATISDALFSFSDGTRIYLYNKALVLLQLDRETLTKQLEDSYYKSHPDVSTLTNAQKNELYKQFTEIGIYQDLTKFVLCVTKADISKIAEAMEKQIQDVMQNWANQYE